MFKKKCSKKFVLVPGTIQEVENKTIENIGRHGNKTKEKEEKSFKIYFFNILSFFCIKDCK